MKISKKIKIISPAFLLLFTVQTVYAMPTIASLDNQNYAQNISSTQIEEIVITDDATAPFVTAKDGVRINIPTGLPVVFEENRTKSEMVVFGTAVTGGKVASKPEISFEDKGKTLFIPVLKDFSAGEVLNVRYLSFKGFHTPTSESQYLQLIYDLTKDPIKDSKYFTVYSSTNTDVNPPEKVTSLSLTQVSDTELKITWTDPTDLDLQGLEVFRSLNGSAIDAMSPYKKILPGVQGFTDANLKIGDTIKYQIRGDDGMNYGTVVETETYTMTKYTPPSVEPVPQPTTPQTPAQPQPTTPTEPTVTPQTQPSQFCQNFTDILPEDTFCAAITNVNKDKILTGYPDGTFKGDNQINRAELLKLALSFAKIEILQPEKNELIFSDVPAGEWYSDCIFTAKKLGIIDGYPNGTFMPSQTVNKAEAVKIILKALKAETGIVSIAPYEDTTVSQNNAWYLPYAQYLKDNVDQNSANFDPSHIMTRKEMVELLSLLSK